MTINNSGVPYRVINSLERATSSDANEFQLFGSKAIVDVFRRLFFAEADFNDDGFKIEAEVITQTTPLAAYVTGGLLANPLGANMFVDAGTLLAIAPDAAPDSRDSVAVIAHSDGINTGGVLPFVANAGAGPRWDLLECRPIQQTTTATRDIFDSATQQFNGTVVDKLIETVLEFRITEGTPATPTAAPTLSAGWLPIAAIWTPNTAASFDDCEIFDVRPLEENINKVRPTTGTGFEGGIHTSGSNPRLSIFYGAVKRGGVGPDARWDLNIPSFNKCTPGESAGQRMLVSSAVGSDYDYIGLGETPGGAWQTIILQFPFGLPNWRRFGLIGEAVSGRRWPGAMQGLPVIMNTVNCEANLDVPAAPMAKEWDTTGNQPGVAVAFVKSGNSPGQTDPYLHIFQMDTEGWFHANDGTSLSLKINNSVDLRSGTPAIPNAPVAAVTARPTGTDPGADDLGFCVFNISGWYGADDHSAAILTSNSIRSNSMEQRYNGINDYITGAAVPTFTFSGFTSSSTNVGMVTKFQIVPLDRGL